MPSRRWRSSTPADAAELVERSGAAAGRCPRRRGRAARSGPAGRSRRPVAPATPRPPGRRRGPAPQLAGLLDAPPRVLGVARRTRPRRAAPRTRRRPSRAGRRSSRSAARSVVELEQVGDVGRGVARAGSSPSGRRSQSVSRSPLGSRMPRTRSCQRRPATAWPAEEPGGELGVEEASSGTVPQASSSTSRSWSAAWSTASAGPVEHRRQRRRGRRRAGRRGRPRRARRAARGRAGGSRCARGGTRCRARSAARRRSVADDSAQRRRSLDQAVVGHGSRRSPGLGAGDDRPARLDPGAGAAGDVGGVAALSARNSAALRLRPPLWQMTSRSPLAAPRRGGRAARRAG